MQALGPSDQVALPTIPLASAPTPSCSSVSQMDEGNLDLILDYIENDEASRPSIAHSYEMSNMPTFLGDLDREVGSKQFQTDSVTRSLITLFI